MVARITPKLSADRAPTEIRTPRDLAYVLFRRADAAMVVFLCVLLPIVAYALLAKSTYRSNAKVLVRVGPESVALATAVGPQPDGGSVALQEVRSELEILNSEALHAQVVEELGLGGTGELEGTERLIAIEEEARRLADDLRIDLIVDTNVITIAYQGEQPDEVHGVVQSLVDGFFQKHHEVHRTQGAMQFFTEQSAELAKRLKAADAALLEARNETGVTSIEAQRTALLERLSSRSAELETARGDLAALSATEEAIADLIGSLPENVVVSSASGLASLPAERLRERLVELKLKEQELSDRYHEDTFIVRNLREQIADVEGLIDREWQDRREITQGLNENRRALEMSLLRSASDQRSLERRIQFLETTAEQLGGEVRELNGHEATLATLELERNLAAESYRRNVQGLEQARIDEAIQDDNISNLSLIESPRRPHLPVGPKRPFLLGVGLLLASICALGAVFLLEVIDDALHTPDQLEASLGLPVVATLARSKDAKLPKDGAQDWAPGDALDASLSAFSLAEAKGRQPGRDPGPLLFAVTAERGAVGTSTVAAALAKRLSAMDGQRVLLMDGDLVRSTLTHAFSRSGEPGWRERLENGGQAAIPKGGVGLALLPAGGQLAAAAESDLDPQQLTDQLREFGEAYTHILVDLPPQGPLEVRTFAAGCDGTFLVADAGRTRAASLRALRSSLESAHAHVAGVVLNRREFPVPAWLYRFL